MWMTGSEEQSEKNWKRRKLKNKNVFQYLKEWYWGRILDDIVFSIIAAS